MDSFIKEVVVKTGETSNLKMRKPNILKEQYKVHGFIDIYTIHYSTYIIVKFQYFL